MQKGQRRRARPLPPGLLLWVGERGDLVNGLLAFRSCPEENLAQVLRSKRNCFNKKCIGHGSLRLEMEWTKTGRK